MKINLLLCYVLFILLVLTLATAEEEKKNKSATNSFLIRYSIKINIKRITRSKK